MDHSKTQNKHAKRTQGLDKRARRYNVLSWRPQDEKAHDRILNIFTLVGIVLLITLASYLEGGKTPETLCDKYQPAGTCTLK